jgi:hypothetical protein
MDENERPSQVSFHEEDEIKIEAPRKPDRTASFSVPLVSPSQARTKSSSFRKKYPFQSQSSITPSVDKKIPGVSNSVVSVFTRSVQFLSEIPEKIPEKWKYPKVVFVILLCLIAEKFGHYGMKGMLFIYFQNFIKLDEDVSAMLFHLFIIFCYSIPVIGGIIADGYIGLYKTIIVAMCVYCVGMVSLTLTSIQPLELGTNNFYGTLISILLISIGTGG